MAKELVIDKNTKLYKIPNKESYEILCLQHRIDFKKLKDFKNIKELIIDYEDIVSDKDAVNNYLETNEFELPFYKRIEKLKYKTGKKQFGPGNKYSYDLTFPNLKSIEFPSTVEKVNSDYLTKCKKIEELVFNVNEYTSYSGDFDLPTNKLNKIIIKYLNKEYIIIPDYKIKNIILPYFNDIRDLIKLVYENDFIKSEININIETNEINKVNILHNYSSDFIKGNTFYIPDYITGLCCVCSNPVNNISFNINLLNNTDHLYLVDDDYLDKIKTIILRNNNEMNLFPEKVIDIRSYGEVIDLYIEDNKLYVDFENCKIIVNQKGEILDEEKTLETEEEKKIELNLTKYKLEELKEYICYQMLLGMCNEDDQEYKKAMEVVEDRVIKRLTKIR